MGQAEKNWLLLVNDVDCNLYTGAAGEAPPIEEGAPESGRTATAMLICRWVDRNDLVAGLVGTVDYQGGTIVRTPPLVYPVAPRDDFGLNPGKMYFARWFCTAVRAVSGRHWKADLDGSVTGLPGWGYYDFAVVAAEFASPPYLIEPIPSMGFAFNDLMGIPYCISKTRTSGEVFSPPTGSFIYNGGTRAGQTLEDTAAGHVRPRSELSCTRVRMPLYPSTVVTQMIGSVNSQPMQLGTQTIPRGAALFTGANPEPRSDPYNGGIVHDVELTWLVNGLNVALAGIADWNFFQDPAGDWVRVVESGSGNPVFAYMDHSQLFEDTIS